MKFGIKFISSENFEALSLEEKSDLIIKSAKHKNIVIVEGGLTPQEETTLISKTMEKVSGRFKGIEICSFNSSELRFAEDKNLLFKIRGLILDVLLKRRGLTIVGPASLVKEIKRDPKNILLKVVR